MRIDEWLQAFPAPWQIGKYCQGRDVISIEIDSADGEQVLEIDTRQRITHEDGAKLGAMVDGVNQYVEMRTKYNAQRKRAKRLTELATAALEALSVSTNDAFKLPEVQALSDYIDEVTR